MRLRMERMVRMRARMETRSPIHPHHHEIKPYWRVHTICYSAIRCIDREDISVDSIYGHHVSTRNAVGNLTASRLSLDEFGIEGCICCLPDLAVRVMGQYKIGRAHV